MSDKVNFVEFYGAENLKNELEKVQQEVLRKVGSATNDISNLVLKLCWQRDTYLKASASARREIGFITFNQYKNKLMNAIEWLMKLYGLVSGLYMDSNQLYDRIKEVRDMEIQKLLNDNNSYLFGECERDYFLLYFDNIIVELVGISTEFNKIVMGMMSIQNHLGEVPVMGFNAQNEVIIKRLGMIQFYLQSFENEFHQEPFTKIDYDTQLFGFFI